jgi:hypothetical protein
LARAFANEAEVEAFRRAQREAEPALIKRLRQHRDTVIYLRQQVARALAQRSGRTEILETLAGSLRGLSNRMLDDIQAANSQRETQHDTASQSPLETQ